jgi:hypothetical protein
MFETEIAQPRPPGVVRLLLQQFLVPSVIAVCGLILSAPIEPRGYDVGLQGAWAILYSFPGLMGFPLAFLVSSKWPSYRPTGRWIWVLPTFLWAHEVLFLGTYLPLSARLALEFTPSGIEGMILAISTIPTLGCICYSAGMTLTELRTRRECLPALQGGHHYGT